MLGALGKLHLVLAETHVLPYAKPRLGDRNTTSAGLHPVPYRENVRFGNSRWRHARRRANRVIVGTDKFSDNVYICAGIFVGVIFIEPIANRTMPVFDDAILNVGIPTHLKVNALSF